MGELNYLTITQPDVSFIVNVLSQFQPMRYSLSHWDAVVRVLRYIKIVEYSMQIGQDVHLIGALL